MIADKGGWSLTGNSLASPVLKTNTVILAIVDFCSSRSSVEDTFGLAQHRLREVTKAVPLTTLLYTIVSFLWEGTLIPPSGTMTDLRGFIE